MSYEVTSTALRRHSLTASGSVPRARIETPVRTFGCISMAEWRSWRWSIQPEERVCAGYWNRSVGSNDDEWVVLSARCYPFFACEFLFLNAPVAESISP